MFISTFNPNNPKVFNSIKTGVNTIVQNNVNGFKDTRSIPPYGIDVLLPRSVSHPIFSYWLKLNLTLLLHLLRLP